MCVRAFVCVCVCVCLFVNVCCFHVCCVCVSFCVCACVVCCMLCAVCCVLCAVCVSLSMCQGRQGGWRLSMSLCAVCAREREGRGCVCVRGCERVSVCISVCVVVLVLVLFLACACVCVLWGRVKKSAGRHCLNSWRYACACAVFCLSDLGDGGEKFSTPLPKLVQVCPLCQSSIDGHDAENEAALGGTPVTSDSASTT